MASTQIQTAVDALKTATKENWNAKLKEQEAIQKAETASYNEVTAVFNIDRLINSGNSTFQDVSEAVQVANDMHKIGINARQVAIETEIQTGHIIDQNAWAAAAVWSEQCPK
jgi:predicted DNA-binding ArsR family transcriptional regulator